MTLEEIRDYCLKKPGTTEDIKWVDNLVFSVGDKMFYLCNPDHIPVTAAFKTSETKFEELIARDGFRQAPYFAKNKWVLIEDISILSTTEWKELIDEAYKLVFLKLTKKLQAEILSKQNSSTGKTKK